ncbi:hypothetical protein CF165_40325 [Amycolatopsis vastitatis]|uniref:Uncharacterized protein n=1 Tax=Amycolatopsis vastitatis TaxID=1905142 RepID=A0A229SQ33_9PSEU|nr:hypothetical protein CF165_40325 [Amycolatopsis vastitatis]
MNAVVTRSTIGTGHVSCASIGSGPHVHTVTGVGSGEVVLVHRFDRGGGPSGREAARVPSAPMAVRVRAPG